MLFWLYIYYIYIHKYRNFILGPHRVKMFSFTNLSNHFLVYASITPTQTSGIFFSNFTSIDLRMKFDFPKNVCYKILMTPLYTSLKPTWHSPWKKKAPKGGSPKGSSSKIPHPSSGAKTGCSFYRCEKSSTLHRGHPPSSTTKMPCKRPRDVWANIDWAIASAVSVSSSSFSSKMIFHGLFKWYEFPRSIVGPSFRT